MNLLILSDAFLFGGMETHVYTYMNNMTEYFKFYLATDNISEQCFLDKKFEKILKFSTNDNFNINLTKLELFIEENNIDVIHCHTLLTYRLCYVLYLNTKKPYFLTIHGPWTVYNLESYIPKEQISDIFRYSLANFAVSEEVQFLLLNKCILSTIVPNSIDTNIFNYKQRKIGSEKWAIVSRLHYDKISGILNALKTLNNIDTIKQIDIFGDGNAIDEIVKFMNSTIINYKINLKGLSNNLAEDLDGGNYCGVMGMGRVALEAMAMGFPCVLIGYNGIKDVIDKDNFDFISKFNFSGRNINLISQENLKYKINDIQKNYSTYVLNSLVENSFNIKDKVEMYISIIKNYYK